MNRKKRLHVLTRRRLYVCEMRCWTYKKCYLSNRLLFGRQAVRLTRIITGPGTPVIMHYWVSKHEYTLLLLTGRFDGLPYPVPSLTKRLSNLL